MKRLRQILKKKAPKYPFVVIEWVDSHYRPGWTAQDITAEPLTCHSVGWLIHDGPEAKTLSANVTSESEPQRCGDMTIPTKAIVRIVTLN